MQRMVRVAKDTVAAAREAGWRRAIADLRRRLFRCDDSLIYVRESWDGAVPSVAGIRVTVVTPEDAQGAQTDIAALGMRAELTNFDRGATCFLATDAESPVGIGWRFPSSRLLKRAGFPTGATYAGGFFVKETARGKGIYGMLLGAIAATLRPDEWPLAVQTHPDNAASRRGLEKAGFHCTTRLRTLIIAGWIVYCRHDEIVKNVER